ncbi:MAG: efflux RND transporter permease subunit [Anaerovoracaceae bacterium]|jgi:HAE1 family hydrophobic/amphiphilic exporter-1
MNLSKIAIRRPVTTIMAVMVVVLVGFLSIIGIPMDLMPDIEFPMAIAFCEYPNAAPEEVENLITIPLEQTLASVENLDSISSMTSEGMSIVMIKFANKTDMNFATLNMREKISLISPYLPDNATEPMVIKMSMDYTPVMQVYIASDSMNLGELNQEIENNIKAFFERTDGVASISAYGGLVKEVAIEFDQSKLVGNGLTLDGISTILSAENINLPGGEIAKGSAKMLVRTIGEFKSVEDIRRLPIPLYDGSIIRLQDIASIGEGYQEQTSISRVDGTPAIGITITKQSTANTVDVSSAVKKTLEKLDDKYTDITFTIGFDQSDYIKNSIASVAKSAIIGGLLAIMVIFLFLRSVPSTMIIAISIPTAFFATFSLMALGKMTLNMITLSALTLAIGMLVDNSIIVTENIYRVNQEDNQGPLHAAEKGSQQIILAISASTLTTVVVFLPIIFSGGMASLLFSDFCLTFIIALASSLLVALTVVPMLSSKLLSTHSNTDYLRIGKNRYRYRILPVFARFVEHLGETYGIFIARALKHKKRVVAISFLIFILSGALISVLGMEFFPASDEGVFTIQVSTPYGTSLDEKNDYMTEFEKHILSIPELSHCTVDIGQTNVFGGNSSTITVVLTPKEKRSRHVDDVMDEIKKKVENLAGAEVTFSKTGGMETMMGSSDLSLTIKGPDLDYLRKLGDTLSSSILEIPGVSDTSTGLEEGSPEVRIIINRSTAAFYGISAYELATSLDSALTGTSSTDLKIGGEKIKINLSLSDDYGESINNMQQIMIPTRTGETVPLGQIAMIEYGNSPAQIDRNDQQRYVTIDVQISGKDLSKTSKAVLAYMDSYSFPAGYYYEQGGVYDEMLDAFFDLFLALMAAVLLVFMVMAAQFESMILSLIVMGSVPFAMSGAFLVLFLTGNTLSITSFAGLIILVGIVVNNAILLVEFIKINRIHMERDKAIILAGQYRLRPILMTTITTIVGMFPLSLGRGDGGEIMAPLAISVMGGLVGSTLVALILIPILYALVDDAGIRRKERRKAKELMLDMLEDKWREEDEKNV